MRHVELQLPKSIKGGIVQQPNKPLDVTDLRSQIKSTHMPKQYEPPSSVPPRPRRMPTNLPSLVPYAIKESEWQRGCRHPFSDAKVSNNWQAAVLALTRRAPSAAALTPALVC